MLLLLSLAYFLQISTAQLDCGYNCLCFDDLVDCSRKNLRTMPLFDDYIMLSTRNLLLRHMPLLDLTSFECEDWINLREINLKGKGSIFSMCLLTFKEDGVVTFVIS